MGSASPASAEMSNPAQSIAPPYAAALKADGSAWRSSLTREGRIPLARPVVQIGRLEGNDVVLTDLLASRHHAVIRWTPQGYELEDLGSSNGTYVQGKLISGRVLLAPGQMIRIGSTEFGFNALQMPGQPTPPVIREGAWPEQQGGIAPTVAGRSAVPPPPVQSAAALGQYGAPPAMAHPYYAQAAQRHENGIVTVFKTEWRKRYWRIFLLGIVAYVVVAKVLSATANLHLVPLVLLLASAVVPVVFVMFCWEQNALADMPLGVVAVTFLLGGVVGLTIAAVLEPVLLPQTGVTSITLQAAILIGLCEETAKVVCVLWFLRDRRMRSELDGLILGAAAGMGFAALESAGYGFVAFLRGFINSLATSQSTMLALEAGARQMNYQLVVRMALAIFGHGVWTAIVAAAIWRERRQSTFRLTPGVLVAFAIAVGLHALWDWSPLVNLLPDSTDPLAALAVIFGWFLFVGALGLYFLRFFLRESLRRAKLGPYAPPLPPLLAALLDELLHPFRRREPQSVYAYAPYPSAAPPQGMPPLGPQQSAAPGYQGQQYPPMGTPPGQGGLGRRG